MKSDSMFLLHAVINSLNSKFCVIERNNCEAGHILPVSHWRKRIWNWGFIICIFFQINLRGLWNIFLNLIFVFLPRLNLIIFKAFNAFQDLRFNALHPFQFELTEHLHLHAVCFEIICVFLLFEITKRLHWVFQFARFL